jgi:hypothetical protein
MFKGGTLREMFGCFLFDTADVPEELQQRTLLNGKMEVVEQFVVTGTNLEQVAEVFHGIEIAISTFADVCDCDQEMLREPIDSDEGGLVIIFASFDLHQVHLAQRDSGVLVTLLFTSQIEEEDDLPNEPEELHPE